MDIFVFEDERVFETLDNDGKKIKLKIVKPTQQELSEADLRYKQKFSQALRMGAMTKAQAEIFIKKNEFMDEDTLKRRDDIVDEINILRDKIVEEKDTKEGIELAKKINELRIELDTINSITMDIYNQTAEAFADDFRIQWLCSELVKNEDGTKYFKDYETFAKSINSQATIDSVRNLILFINNLKNNFEMEYEENKWLQDNKIIDQDGSINIKEFLDVSIDEDVKKEKKKTKPKAKKKNVRKASKKQKK